MSHLSLYYHPSLESSSSVGESLIRPSLFDAREDFIERVAPLGMGAIYFGSFTLAPQDAALSRQALYKLSFLYRNFLRASGLRILVQRKTAFLLGPTLRDPLLLLAELLARQIEGIVEVKNETEPSSVSSSPLKIAKESIQLLFATDQTLRSGIQVNIVQGRLTLDGEISSTGQKTWAEKIAQGVTADIDSHLRVSEAAPSLSGTPFRPIELDDESLQALVLLRLRLTRETENLPVKVHAKRGVLTLQGKVRTEALRQRAENIARSTLGLTELRSSLSIAT